MKMHLVFFYINSNIKIVPEDNNSVGNWFTIIILPQRERFQGMFDTLQQV